MTKESGITPWWLQSNAAYRKRYGTKEAKCVTARPEVESKKETAPKQTVEPKCVVRPKQEVRPTPKQADKLRQEAGLGNKNPITQQSSICNYSKEGIMLTPKLTSNTRPAIWSEGISNFFNWIFLMIIVFVVTILVYFPIIRICKILHWERFEETIGLLSFVISLFTVLFIGSEVIPNIIDSRGKKK